VESQAVQIVDNSPISAADIDQKIEVFVGEIKRRSDAYYARNLKNLTPPTFTVTKGSKYAAVRNETSIVCFIARQSFHNLSMGEVNAGDVFKPATASTPAKHARGNVLTEDEGFEALTEQGSIIYLK